MSAEATLDPPPAPTPTPGPRRWGLRPAPTGWHRALRVAVALLALGTLAGQAGGWWWIFGLAQHFALHALLLAAVCAVYAVALRAWCSLGLVLGLAALHAVPLWRHAGGAPPPVAGTDRWRLAVSNVNQDFGHKGRVLNWLSVVETDAVVLVEVDGRWLGAIGTVQGRFPHRADLPRPDRFGLAVLSRHPIRRVQPLWPVPGSRPTLWVELETPLGRVGLLAVHPPPPVSAALSAERDALLAALPGAVAPLARATPAGVVLAGDFNATPWSAPFEPLYAAGFDHGRRGLGLAATWPAALGDYGIPIDHLLTRGPLAVSALRVAPDLGSDHRALEAELGRRAP